MVSIIIEKAVKRGTNSRGVESTDINIAYVLFWCYFFSLITLILFFWTDVIPGFGMADDIVDFAKT